MSENRKEPRKKLIAFTPVYASKPRKLLGYVGNLNLLGVMVIGEHPVEVNTELLLIIEFPKNLPNATIAEVTLNARATWCRRDSEGAPYYNIGFEFIDATPDQTRIFQAILERYQFRQDIPTPRSRG